MTNLKNILTTYTSAYQALNILRSTDTCVPGLYPLIFPTRSRSTPPILKEFGVVGGEAYQLLRVASREGPIRLHCQLVVEIGKNSTLKYYSRSTIMHEWILGKAVKLLRVTFEF